MANPPGTRKRVRADAVRRGPDGSAFRKCQNCGISVAIALADMHECEPRRKGVKIEAECTSRNITKQGFHDQPRSPFHFFMESFAETCKARDQIELDRKGFETWRSMSNQERRIYVLQAEKVNSAYVQALLQEVEDMSSVDDEADSAEIGRFDKNYEHYKYYYDSENTDGFESFWSEGSESFNTYNWGLLRSHIIVKSP